MASFLSSFVPMFCLSMYNVTTNSSILPPDYLSPLYIFNNTNTNASLTCSFLPGSFSPSLSLQAAVAATSATTAGAPGAPRGLPQGAPGSPSPGPASHNIPSVNEGTD